MSAELSTLQQTYRALERARQRIAELESARRAPVAIVGIGCRFPGGIEGPAGLRAALLAGRDAVARDPRAAWAERLAEPEAPAEALAQPAGLLEAVYDFDPAFFGISPREAELMDPQQRHVLEIAYRALEDAGLGLEAVRGRRVGIFLGAAANEYHRQCFAYAKDKDLGYVATGNAHNAIAGRLAHLLGTHGPALVVDTACSSALVAVHLAIAALRSGECELALAGGVNLLLDPLGSAPLLRAGMLSPSGACRAFDARADGYVRSEGCGVVVLLPAAAARRAGHRVYANLAGSAVNHDGAASSLTAPSGQAQQLVIRAALADAGVAPGAVQYVEAHGTGTPLGDPIELQALAAVYLADPARPPLAVGAAKANLGHTEAASGIAGLIKTALGLAGAELLPSLHFERWNPATRADPARFDVVTAPRPWAVPPGATRTAAVSSFGFTGTNAHVVLQAAPPASAGAEAAAAPSAAGAEVFCLSAKSAAALAQQAEALARRLRHDAPGLRDLCLSSQLGRSAFGVRAAWLVRDHDELRARLRAASAAPPSAAARLAQPAGLWFASTLGAVVERPELDALALAFPPLGRRLAELQRTAAAAGAAAPAGFVLVVALAQTLIAAGIEPAWLAGERDGTLAAAVVAGQRDLVAALRSLARAEWSEAHAERSAGAQPTIRLGSAPALEPPADAGAEPAAGAAPPTLVERCLRLFAASWTAFAPLDWRELRDGVRFARVALAEHPFARQRYQVGAERRAPGRVAVDAATAAFLAEHEVLGTPVVPGAFWLALVAERARAALRLSGVCFHAALVLDPPGALPELTLADAPGPAGSERAQLKIASTSLHFSATRNLAEPPAPAERELRWTLPEDAPSDEVAALYAAIRGSAGIAHGPRFRLITRLAEREGTHFAELTLPAGLDPAAQPLAGATALLDACLQVLGLAAIRRRERRSAAPLAAIPFAIDALALARIPAERRFRCIARLRSGDEAAGVAIGDVELETAAGEPVASARGVSFKEVSLGFEAALRQRGSDDARPSGARSNGTPALYALGLEPLAERRPSEAVHHAPIAVVASDPAAALELSAALAARGVRSAYAGRAHDRAELPAGAHVVALLDRTPSAPAAEPAAAHDAYVRAVAELAGLARALGAAGGTGGRRCTLVLRDGLAPADALRGSDPLHAAAAAFFASAAWELPGWRFRFLDLRGAAPAEPLVLDALLAADGPSHAVVEGARAMVPVLAPLDLARSGGRVAIRPDRSYLVSGGHGSLGRAAADWLARSGGTQIVLLGRTAPDAAALAAVRALRARGVAVRCETLDVADDAGGLAALVARLDRSPYPLAGVVHAAGCLADRPAGELDPAAVAAGSRAKLQGTLALLAATSASRLDFLVGFSSLSALIGNAGQANYAAANAGMDALLARARRAGVRAFSAQWGPWSDSAMVRAIPPAKLAALHDLGIGLLSAAEAFEALEAQLAADAPSCVIARVDWARLGAALGGRDSRLPAPPAPTAIAATAASPAAAALAELLRLSPGDRHGAMLGILRAELAGALGLASPASIPADQGLFELGLDSLAALDLREALERALQVEVPPTALFNYPTLDLFAAFLLERLAPASVVTAAPANGAAAGAAATNGVPPANRTGALDGELSASSSCSPRR